MDMYVDVTFLYIILAFNFVNFAWFLKYWQGRPLNAIAIGRTDIF